MYTWIVYLHILGAFAFALAHGTSMLVAFRVRATRDVSRISELLALSQLATRLMYVGLLLLLVGGIWAAFDGDWWGKAWVWLALGVLIAVGVVMYAVATPFYGQMRAAAGLGQGGATSAEGAVTDPAGLEQLATSRRPEVLALVGGFGLAVILWLMVVKPF
jgi:hypothetical protein